MTPRPGLESEIGQVVGLWESCGLTRPWNDPRVDIRRCLEAPGAELLVVDDPHRPGQLAGTVMVGSDGHRGWLYYLAVGRRHRGQGLGRTLVRHAEAWLVARGIPKVMLMVRQGNEGVGGFYASLGYHPEPRLNLARWLDGTPPPDTA